MTEKRDSGQESVNATIIGKHFGISPNKINSILSDIGWIKKDNKGWVITDSGKRVGGQQSRYKTGRTYAHWPKSILDNNTIAGRVHGDKGELPTTIQDQTPIIDEVGFRDKYPAKHRADDGHVVRSIAEQNIDNWLYRAEVVHAYEKKPRIEEDVLPDFYLPTGKVYIEYWGYANNPKYSANKKRKLEIYHKHDIEVIELNTEDIKNLDDILPKKLRKYGIETE